MVISQLSQDELIVQSRIAIGNAQKSGVIQGCLAEWGYTAERLTQGQDLLDTVVRLSQVQVDGLGDQKNATFDKDVVWQEADQAYMRLLKVARVAVKRPGDRSKLRLDGEREQDFAGWVQQANSFYQQALENADILAQLAEFNLTPSKLEAGQTLVEQVEAARADQTAQIGTKQNATADRDAAVEALRKWMSDYQAIALVALEDQPQLLESLGISVPSNPHTEKGDTSPVPVTPPPGEPAPMPQG